MAELLPENALRTPHDGRAMDELDGNIDLAQRPIPGECLHAPRARAPSDADAPRRSRSA